LPPRRARRQGHQDPGTRTPRCGPATQSTAARHRTSP